MATDQPTTTAEPSTSAYVANVNQLCDALIDEVVPVTGDAAPTPTRERFLENRSQLVAVYKTFDTAVDAIPVETEADQSAEEAFDAYLAALKRSDTDLAAKAAKRSRTEWKAAAEESLQAFFNSPERNAMLAVGISCPAR